MRSCGVSPAPWRSQAGGRPNARAQAVCLVLTVAQKSCPSRSEAVSQGCPGRRSMASLGRWTDGAGAEGHSSRCRHGRVSGEGICLQPDPGLISGLGRPPGGGNGNPLRCSCLENSMDRGGWRATVHGVTKRWTRLSG